MLPREAPCEHAECPVSRTEGYQLPVLDHGYVRFIEHWGSDERIIESARMSTGKGFEGWEKDAKLLRFLWKNQHHTPFEMAGLVVEVKAPIFVFREWHRHRVPFSYNEMSARYIPLPDENYLPSDADIVARSAIAANTSNRQASGLRECTAEEASNWRRELDKAYAYAQRVYEQGIKLGVPKELARLPVPVARYSRMRASSNLRGWLHFLNLRMAPNAQWEIRQYANAVGTIISQRFPKTWGLFKGDEDGTGRTES